MKKGVLIFGLVFVSLMVALTFARFNMDNALQGISGNVIREDYNPVFGWRDFNIGINSVSSGRDYVDVLYNIREFTNNSQVIDISFYIGESGRDIEYSGTEKLVVPANSDSVYTKRFLIPVSGNYKIGLEATNDRKIASDEMDFVFAKSAISGDVIQEVRESDSKNLILLVIGIILIIIILIEVKNKRKVVEHYKSKHSNRFIDLDLK